MKKSLLHIWRYLTSATYRAYVDLQMTQQAIDAHADKMREQLEFASRVQMPPFIYDIMDRYGCDAEGAVAIHNAHRPRV
jgi:hypothetical protein